MSDQTSSPTLTRPAFWRRGLAGLLDFITVFFVGGYAIGSLTGETTNNGFNLNGLPALVLLVLIVAYFYFGWKVWGGTIWQRILGARPVP
ncbi:MAG TPA: RDD family protein [Bradyrhizobium sp.]|uniref:RDD family protein n=1 Tax=Bradyrhizobium sp. TaxID=376 RepID=UPI002D801F9F|nr:RDD family protein [Bradyrhizobium sp.]HET7886917.1 RDD family protein [Bradyrhizobium sp.]